MEIGSRLESAIEVVAICAAVTAVTTITKNPICLWGLLLVMGVA